VLTGVAAVAAGDYHTLALKTDGSLWAWGRNWTAQLGDGTTKRRLTPVQVLTEVATLSAGTGHSLAIKTDDSLWAWGDNDHGQLGDSTTADRLTPVQVLTGVAAVTAGGYHTLAIKTDGSFWNWGFNYHGQLGDGTTKHRLSPIPVADFAAPPAADFMVTGVTLTPRDPLANGTFSATITVRNQGTAAGAPGALQIWADQADTQGCAATGDQSATMASIAIGARRTVTVNGLPTGTAGSKTLRVFIDSQCATAEITETNNQFTWAYNALELPTPDFVVTGIVLTPGSPSADGSFSATITVKNKGSGSGPGGNLTVWADQPTVPTCGAAGGAVVGVGTLAADASTTLTVDGLLGGAAGAKTLRAFVDSDCGTPEAREGNNQRVTAYTVGP
jgi:hypothetical protein